MRDVIFIQSKFPSSEHASETLFKRWEAYACELEAIHGINQITIVSPYPLTRISSLYSHLSFISKSKWRLKNLLDFLLFVKSTKRPVTLVCGDSHISILISIICRWLYPDRVLIQCQFHGDLYTLKNNPGPKGLIRVLLSRLAIYLTDSIRIVSEFQKAEIINIAPKLKKSFVVAPIPIDYSKIPNQRSNQIIYDVVIVGRLHKERGIENAILIVKEIAKRRCETKIAFVGAGNLMQSTSHILAEEILNGSVVLLGELCNENLRDVYACSKILLSTAPHEGYGLTLREAYLSGMVVVVKNSKGAHEASLSFPGNFVFYESVQEAARYIVHEIDNFSENSTRGNLISAQQEKDCKNTRKLLDSWINS